MENYKFLHSKAVEIVGRYKKTEVELVEVLQDIDKTKAYLKFNCTSLFDYCVKVLGLTDSVTYNFITVSRKASQIPELKTAIKTGELTVSKARKITSVIKPETQTEWISKAISLSSRALEKEVAKVSPQALTPERTKYVREDRININLGLSEEFFKKLKRVQDLESQRLSKSASLEDALQAMLNFYIEKKDPLEKARRNIKGLLDVEPRSTVRPVTGRVESFSNISSHRSPVPAQLRHQINLRDQGKCGHTDCNQGRWLDVHHIIPVSQGGKNTLENLKTLCSAHHRIEHLK